MKLRPRPDGDNVQRAEANVAMWVARNWLVLVFTAIVIIAFSAAAIYLPRNPAARAASLLKQINETTFQDPKDALALKKDLLQYETDSHIKIWTALAQL